MRALMLLVVLALTAVSPASVAQGTDRDLAGAREAFRQGRALLQEGKLDQALVQFKRSHELSQDGLVMGFIALIHERRGDFAAAIEALQIYRAKVPEQDRAEIDTLLEKYREAQQGGPQPASAVKPTGAAATDLFDSKRKRFWTWIAAGTSAALALGALVVGVSAVSSYSSLEEGCQPACPTAQADSVRARAVATDVLLAGAVASGVAAMVLFLLEGRPAEQSSAGLTISPGAGRGGLGLQAQVRF